VLEQQVSQEKLSRGRSYFSLDFSCCQLVEPTIPVAHTAYILFVAIYEQKPHSFPFPATSQIMHTLPATTKLLALAHDNLRIVLDYSKKLIMEGDQQIQTVFFTRSHLASHRATQVLGHDLTVAFETTFATWNHMNSSTAVRGRKPSSCYTTSCIFVFVIR
jgi:hypothetical protein